MSMSFKCPFFSCERTFSQRSAYSQHVKRCIKRTELESGSDSDDNISEKNENKVTILIFHLVRNTKI